MKSEFLILLSFLILWTLISVVNGGGVLPGSVKACEIKKLSVRVTRIMYTMYGDTSEPPVTRVIVNYYDPQSKTAKQIGVTEINTNGRSLFPVWDKKDGTVSTDDNPGIQ